MTDMQINLPLLIVRPSILNPIINFSTHLWPVKWKCPMVIPLHCAFYSNSSDVDATHVPTNHRIIWSTSYHHVIVLVHRSWPHLLFTVALVHRRRVFPKLYRHMRSLASKPMTCHSHLQPVHRAKPYLDLLHLGHRTSCHVSYAISSFMTQSHMN
jgi:hypothetical protein